MTQILMVTFNSGYYFKPINKKYYAQQKALAIWAYIKGLSSFGIANQL